MAPRVPTLLSPGQADVGRIDTPPLKDALRSVLCKLDHRPVSMKLDESATTDGPEKPGAARSSAAEQNPGIPAEPGGTFGPPLSGVQEVVAVLHELAPTMWGNLSQRTLIWQARYRVPIKELKLASTLNPP
jgi:hypothetical protein